MKPQDTWIWYQLLVTLSCISIALTVLWVAFHVVSLIGRLQVIIKIENIEAKTRWSHEKQKD